MSSPESPVRFRVVRADGTWVFPGWGELPLRSATEVCSSMNRRGGGNVPYRVQEMVWQDWPLSAEDHRRLIDGIFARHEARKRRPQPTTAGNPLAHDPWAHGGKPWSREFESYCRNLWQAIKGTRIPK
jgi:hypothetical protein